MKHFLWVFLLLAFSGCKKTSEKVATRQTAATPQGTEFRKPGYSIETEQQLEIPPGFSLDTIQLFDPDRNSQYRLVLPVSSFSTLDKLIKDSLFKEKEKFLAYIDEGYGKGNAPAEPNDPLHEFYAFPVSIYANDNLVSYLFMVSDYLGGAPHASQTFISFNFDTRSNRFFKLNGYLKLNSKQDSSALLTIINAAVRIPDTKIYNLKDFDFNIEKDTTSLNFGGYDITPGGGTERIRIPKDAITGFIRPAYR